MAPLPSAHRAPRKAGTMAPPGQRYSTSHVKGLGVTLVTAPKRAEVKAGITLMPAAHTKEKHGVSSTG